MLHFNMRNFVLLLIMTYEPYQQLYLACLLSAAYSGL